jgi:hypothetical protein
MNYDIIGAVFFFGCSNIFGFSFVSSAMHSKNLRLSVPMFLFVLWLATLAIAALLASKATGGG